MKTFSQRPRIASLAYFVAGIWIAAAAHAGVIYQWVDENGRTQMSDSVPDRYKSVAKRVETKQFDVSPAARKSADARATALRLRAARIESASGVAATPASAEARAIAAPASAAATSASDDKTSDCPTWRQRFATSRNCFARFTLADGSLRPGAFQACGADVPNPEPTCGPENWR